MRNEQVKFSVGQSPWLRFVWIFVLIAALSAGITHPAFAQSTATLNGTVTDATGAAIASAKIVAKNQATGIEFTSQTDDAGAYLFPTLPIGVYDLQITASGFETSVVSNLKLEVATTVTRNVQLRVGQTSDKVVIVAESAQVDVATNSVSQVITDKTVQEIPLNGRHFTDLSLLTPGTITPPANGFLSAPLRGQGSFGINTAGQREDTTNWLVNGINLNDPSQNQITFQPPIDTLAEYKIDNSAFPAQYGRNSGAIVNLATRSGTNEYHGELFEFLRNNDLDARNFFNPTTVTVGGAVKPNPQNPFKRNDFGVDFGGPIIKNKLFFFLAYEGLRQRQQLTLSTPVPSLNDRAAATSPAVKSLLSLVPSPNFQEPNSNQTGTEDLNGQPNTFTGFTGSATANVSLNQGSSDLDYDMSDKDRFHGYFVVQKDHRQEPTQSANLPGFGDTRDGLRDLVTFSEDHTFGPSLTNTVRLGYNRIRLIFTPTALNAANFNINVPAGAPVGVGLPNIVLSGGMSFGGPTGEPQGRGDTTVVLNDTLSWLKGRHTFAYGGEIRRAYNNNIAESIGSFTFNPTGAGATAKTAIQNFIADNPSNFTVLLGAGNDRILQPAYAWFAQDSFKWRSNFTINYGLRYEWNSTPSEARGRFTNFDLATGTLVPATQPFQTNNKNFEPRIGFAWDPFKNGKTSVRAGYAIMTQDPTAGVVSGLSGNPNFALPLNINTSTTNVVTLENPAPTTAPIFLGPSAISPNFKNMYTQDWNLTIQRQVTSSLGLEVAYVGNKGTHLQLTQNINQPLVTNNTYGTTRPFGVLPASSAVFPTQCATRLCTFANSNINEINSVGNSNYNALWVTLDKHFSRGFQFLATYTYSKSLDYNSLSGGESYVLQNSYNPRGDYGPSEFDVRNRFALSGFYQLPFKANRLVSGWQVGIITQAQSGNPLNPTVSINPGPGTLTVRPDLIGPIQTTGNPADWFVNRGLNSFAIPCTTSNTTGCHPGSLGRDAITGPDFVNTDFSVFKDTKINERFNLQFRSEMFDIFNHPNFGNPLLTFSPTSTTFGTITSTRFPTGDFGSSRQIQFALKLEF